MSLGDGLRDSSVWHRQCADIIDSISYIYGGQATWTIGPPNAYVISTSVPVVSLSQGQRFRFTPASTNNGAATLQVNTIAAKSILRYAGSALQANDLIQSVPAEVEYSVALDSFILQQIAYADGDFANLTTSVPTGAYNDVTTRYAKYSRQGKWVRVLCSFHGTTTATPAYITFNLPVSSANLGATQVSMGSCQDGASVPAFIEVQDNSFACRIYRSDLANFGTGAARGAYCSFTYLSA